MIKKIADWRNWRLPVKLAAVLVVPVAVAVGSGVLQINGYVERADSYSAMQRLVKLRAALLPVLSGVQVERGMVVQGVDAQGVAQGFANQVKATDAARDTLRQSVVRTPELGDVVRSRIAEADKRLDGLPALREQRTGGYSDVIDALLDVDEALGSEFGDVALSRSAGALHEALNVQEQLRNQQAIVLGGLVRGQLADAEVRALRDSNVRLKYTMGRFSALVTPAQLQAYWQRFSGPDVEAHQRLLDAAMAREGAPLPFTADEWNKVTGVVADDLDDVVGGLLGELRSTADRLRDVTSDQAGGASAILFGMLIVASTVGFVIGRYLLRSLNTLRRTALDVAWNRLPEVVRGSGQGAEIERVPVHTTEEFGELARAFDVVHQEAVRAAVEQTALRANMRNIFVNLSRRSQSLVERQLRLMEELEKYEEDPEQLANLFKLDHLATRMRRNNENLMVLSGSDVARRYTKPVALTDVLRAGASEIEQYQRVVVHATPSADVLGYVASDLVRLIAELLDNAAAFSPPHTQVVIGARTQPDGSVRVEINDRGIGMSPDDLAAANDRLAALDGAEVQVFRDMGLFVVGRLAVRHRITVRLEHGERGVGVDAFVTVPADMVSARTDEPAWSSFQGQAVEDGGASWFEGSQPVHRTPELSKGFLDSYQRGVRQGAPDWQESR